MKSKKDITWKGMLSQDNFYWKDTNIKLKHKSSNAFDICLYYNWNRFSRPIARITQDAVYCFHDYSENNLYLVLDCNKRSMENSNDVIFKFCDIEDDNDVIVRFWGSEKIPFFKDRDLEVAKFKAWLLITEKIIKQTEIKLKEQEVLFRTRLK